MGLGPSVRRRCGAKLDWADASGVVSRRKPQVPCGSPEASVIRMSSSIVQLHFFGAAAYLPSLGAQLKNGALWGGCRQIPA